MPRQTSSLFVFVAFSLLGIFASSVAAQSGSSQGSWAGAFAGEGVRLTLESNGGGYAGTLRFQGESFPATATVGRSDVLRGSFKIGENDFAFEVRRTAAGLQLSSGGATYALSRSSGGKKKAFNPLAKKRSVPPVAQEVYSGPTTTVMHGQDWYSFELPQSWKVVESSDHRMIINPGLGAEGPQEALVGVFHHELPLADRGRPVNEVLDGAVLRLASALAAEGITVDEPRAPSRRVRIEDTPGAVLRWSGETLGEEAVAVVGGGVIQRDHLLVVVAVIVKGKDDQYLPGLKRVGLSLTFRPAPLNEPLQKGLEGSRVVRSDVDGTTVSTYRFSSDGKVERSGGTETVVGRYEVVGYTLYLRFPDGQEVGVVVTEGGSVAGVRFGRVFSPTER